MSHILAHCRKTCTATQTRCSRPPAAPLTAHKTFKHTRITFPGICTECAWLCVCARGARTNGFAATTERTMRIQL